MKKVFCLILCLSSIILCSHAQKKDSIQKNIYLDEVVVKADRKLIKFEANKVILDATQIRKGKVNMFDLLKEIPSVIASGDEVSIFGKGAVKVMINGRLKQMSGNDLVIFLKTKPASNVNKIEVVKEPGAKYDAEGNFGLINFILDKPKDNYLSGQVSNTVQYSYRWLNMNTSNIEYNHKKFSPYLSGNWQYGQSPYKETNVQHIGNAVRHVNSPNWPRRNNYYILGGSDYRLDSLSTLNLEGFYNNMYSKNEVNSDIRTFTAESPDIVQSIDRSQNKGRYASDNYNFSFYIDRNLPKGSSIKFISDYYNYKTDRNIGFTTDSYDGQDKLVLPSSYYYNQAGYMHLTGISCSLDLTLKLPRDIEFCTGMKPTFSTIKQVNWYERSNMSDADDSFKYMEKLYAFYATLSKNFGKKIYVRVGGRIEATHVKTEPKDLTQAQTKNYANFVPDIQFNYTFGNNTYLNVETHGGISRPRMDCLNSFLFYSSPYLASKGDPAIRPKKDFKMTINYGGTFSSWAFNLDLCYVTEKDRFFQISSLDETKKIQILTWMNADNRYTYGAEGMLYFGKWSWMKSRLFGWLYFMKTKVLAGDLGINNEANTHSYGSMLMTNFFFDKKHRFTGNLDLTWTGLNKSAIMVTYAKTTLSAGLSYSCCKDRLNMSFDVENITNPAFSGRENNKNVWMSFKNYYNPLTFKFAISYSFGKHIRLKSKSHSSRDILIRVPQ